MTEQEMRIAVAESVGWTWWKHTKSETYLFCWPDTDKASLDDHAMEWEKSKQPNPFPHFVSLSGVPNYPQDLNAMHEVEKTLNATEQIAYTSRLHKPFDRQRHWAHVDFDVLHTTANQRCEAYLRVKGLWK